MSLMFYIPDPDLTVDKMDTLEQIVARVFKRLDAWVWRRQTPYKVFVC